MLCVEVEGDADGGGEEGWWNRARFTSKRVQRVSRKLCEVGNYTGVQLR